MTCDDKFDTKTVFYEWDFKVACKDCYEGLPFDVRRRLDKYQAIDKKAMQKEKASPSSVS